MRVQVYVSIGSNIDRVRNIRFSLDALKAEFGELEISSVYESAAVGFDSEPFYNLVVGFASSEPARVVQEKLHAMETVAGRDRDEKMAARSLDLDLLLYGDSVVNEDGLVLPREDIQRYAFVLRPLAEIAADRTHPLTDERYADMWQAFDARGQDLKQVDWSRLA